MNKKAILKSNLIALLAIAFVIVFIVPMGVGFAKTIKATGDVETCRLSVIAQSSTNFLGKSPFNFKCDRRDIDIYDDKVTLYGSKQSKYPFSELNAHSTHLVIANELKTCWYQMGRGELDAFRQDVFTLSKPCLICSEIQFNTKEDQTFPGILDFLQNTKISPAEPTYFIDLHQAQTSNRHSTDEISNQPIDTTKDYVVFFKSIKARLATEAVADSDYFIGFAPQSQLVDHCGDLAN